MKIVQLPNTGCIKSAHECLNKAKEINLEAALVVGIDVDGDFRWESSQMCKKDALWLLEKAKKEILEL